MSDNTPSSGTGISGTARLVVGLVVLTLATLGVLVVFDVIPRETLVNISGKLVLSGVIVIAASLGIGLLAKR